jgi:hypothetical protein
MAFNGGRPGPDRGSIPHDAPPSVFGGQALSAPPLCSPGRPLSPIGGHRRDGIRINSQASTPRVREPSEHGDTRGNRGVFNRAEIAGAQPRPVGQLLLCHFLCMARAPHIRRHGLLQVHGVDGKQVDLRGAALLWRRLVVSPANRRSQELRGCAIAPAVVPPSGMLYQY